MPGQPAHAYARSRMSPGDSLSRIAGLPPALPQSSSKLKKLSRFHCRHFAARRGSPQQENLVCLCRSCELCGLLVESDGKNRVKCVFACWNDCYPRDKFLTFS
jgi:hypothetical protein